MHGQYNNKNILYHFSTTIYNLLPTLHCRFFASPFYILNAKVLFIKQKVTSDNSSHCSLNHFQILCEIRRAVFIMVLSIVLLPVTLRILKFAVQLSPISSIRYSAISVSISFLPSSQFLLIFCILSNTDILNHENGPEISMVRSDTAFVLCLLDN